MRTFPTASCRPHEFLNVHYFPTGQWPFQTIRIKFLTIEGLHVPYEVCAATTNWCFIFAEINNDILYLLYYVASASPVTYS